MKLYGKIKSERAEKGQGGNDYLEIKILNISQNVVATINVIQKDKIEIVVSRDQDLAEVILK